VLPFPRPKRPYGFKPLGSPTIDRSVAPRGIFHCAPCVDNGMVDLVSGLVGTQRTGGVNAGITPSSAGMGFDNWFTWFRYPAAFGPPWSLELVVVYKGSTGTDYSWVDYDEGGNGIRLNTAGKAYVKWWNGSAFITATSTSALTTGLPYHIVATADASNLNLYLNGLLQQSTSWGGGTAQSITAHINVGGNVGSGTGLHEFVVFHLAANVTWTAAEVLVRANNTYNFLIYPQDQVMAMMFRAPAAASSPIFRRSLSGLGTRTGSRQVQHW
jgi:hypothetical protein